MRRNQIQGLIVAFIVLAVASPPTVEAASPPDSCLAYAFTESDNHRFLIGSNLTAYGNEINLVHDCGRAEIWIDGSFYAEGETGLSVSVEAGNYTVELRGQNQTWTYSNVEIRPDRLDWDFNFSLVYDREVKLIPESEAKVMQNWAAGATGLIIWVLCVYVYWNLINSYTQRNFIEEVQG